MTSVHGIAAAAGVGLASMSLGQISTFDDGPQGWTFDVAAAWRATDGNPGGCVQNFEEPTNGLAWVYAPPSYLGDWTRYEGKAVLKFDHRRVTNGGGRVLSYIPIRVEASGPAGTVRWESELLPDPGSFIAYELPIEASAWDIVDGSDWSLVIAHVTTLRFFLEQVSNTDAPEDLNLLDNVRFESLCPADQDGNGQLNVFDFLLYQTRFSEQDPNADLAPPFGVFNVFDFLAFQSAFGAGCE